MIGQVIHDSQIIPALNKLVYEHHFYIEIQWGEEIAIYENANDVIGSGADAVTLIETVYNEKDSNFLACIKKMLNRFNKWLEDNYQYVRAFRDNWNIETLYQLREKALGWYDEEYKM